MKYTLLFLLSFLFIYQSVNAQIVRRNIRFRSYGVDSVNLPLNENYNLIEDSCVQIIRRGHFNFRERKFFGKFKDVSKLDTNLIVSEGTYTIDGLKNGEFISHYLNGNLQAKGSYKNNNYDGKWEINYEDGKPQITFEVIDGDLHVIDAWKPDGSKTVDNGKGTYVADYGSLAWKGKIVNGKPDGTWNLVKVDDINEMAMSTEQFKKGQFRNGSVGSVDYTDVSHIILVSPYKLPFVNAERLVSSQVPCNGAKRKHYVNAQYFGGFANFSEAIKDVVTPYLSRVDLKGIDNTINIEGVVSEQGSLESLKNSNSFREDIAHGLTLQLRRLPLLHPATADGKPVKQRVVISFVIMNGFYSFNYRFLPIEEK